MVTPSQFEGEGSPPTKWSFSSAVMTKSVFLDVIPSCCSRAKKSAKAWLYAASWATYPASPG